MRRIPSWVFIFGVWLVLSLVATEVSTWGGGMGAEPVPASQVWWIYLASNLFHASDIVVVGLLAGWFRIERGRLARDITVHLVAASLVLAVNVWFNAWLFARFWPWSVELQRVTLGELAVRFFQSRWQFQIVAYAGILAVIRAVDLARDARASEVQAAELQGQLAQAQLAALRMQLNPHFLFNTLQAISTLVVENPPAARRMLVLLGDLLRTALDDNRPEVPLEHEVDFLRRYLEIEQVRFPDRLRVAWHVAPDVGDALVPGFLLQPLVENAIRHGVAPRKGVGTVTVRVGASGDRLRLSVEDDGPGPTAGARDGVGLSATRARLEKRYGAGHRFSLGPAPAGGTLAAIEIPLARRATA